MSDPISNKPDLDESTKVHEDAAAVARENRQLAEGSEPLSLWVILGSALIVLVSGGVLFGGGVFDYKNMFKSGYVRQAVPSKDGGGIQPKPAIQAYMRVGKKVYDSCSGCHQPGGEGNAAYPPLAGSEWVNENSLRPALIILNGIHGQIRVAGKDYNGNMPSMGSGMDAKQLAGVLNYIRNSFGNQSDTLITLEMAEEALAVSKKRGGGQVTAEELNANFNRDLQGAELPMDTLVDPRTLQPVPEEK